MMWDFIKSSYQFEERGKEDCTRIRRAVSQPSTVCGYSLHVLHLAVILSILIITTILHGFCSQDMLSDTPSF